MRRPCGYRSLPFRSPSGHRPAARRGGSTSSAVGAVTAYFKALNEGDATTALALTDSPPSDRSLLTREALEGSTKAKPFADLTVHAEQNNSPLSAVAVYTLDGQQMAIGVGVVQQPDKTDKVKQGVSRMSLSSDHLAAIGVKIDGVTIKSDTVYVFPGVHTFSTDNPYLQLDNTTFTVGQPGYQPRSTLKVSLTTKAQTDLRAAAKVKLNSCLQAKQIDNPDCGITFPPKTLTGSTLVASSMSCSLNSGTSALDAASFEPMPSDPSIARAFAMIGVSCGFNTKEGGTAKGTTSIQQAQASVLDPQHLVVTLKD